MTNPLRELIAKATPGEWSVLGNQGYTVWRGNEIIVMAHEPRSRLAYAKFDARLIVHLRNHAEAIADLIDAAQKYIAAQEVEAKTMMAARVAEENYSNPKRELDEAYNATIKAMECRRILCAALSKLTEGK